MSSNKNADLCLKSSLNQDDDEDSDIEFIAEFKELPKTDIIQAIEETSSDSPTTSFTHEFTYTQENDSNLDFSTDEEEDFWKKVDSVSSNCTSKTNGKTIESDTEDDEEDEDIRLIFDSKELLDKIDGKLKSIIDLTSDEEGVITKKGIITNEISKDVSPIVCRTNSITNLDFKNSNISIKNEVTTDQVKPSTSMDADHDMIHLDKFVFNQDCTMRDSDISSDEGDFLLVQMADKYQADYELNKSISRSPVKTQTTEPTIQLFASDCPEIPEIFTSLSVQKLQLNTKDDDTISTDYNQCTVESDISKFSEVNINFSEEKKTQVTARIQSPIVEKSSSFKQLSYSSNSPQQINRSEVVLERIDLCKELKKESLRLSSNVSLNEKVLSASALSTNRLKRLNLLENDDEGVKPKKKTKALELIKDSSSESSENSQDAMFFSDLREKYNLGSKTSTKPPPVTKESLYSSKSVAANTASEAALSKPLSDVVKRIAAENMVRTTKIMEPPVSGKRSRNLEINRPSLMDSGNEKKKSPTGQQPSQRLSEQSLISNLPKRPADIRKNGNSVENSAPKRLKIASPVKFTLMYKKAVQSIAEKKTDETTAREEQTKQHQSATDIRLNSIDIQKRSLLQKIGGKIQNEKRTNSKAMEDLKKYSAREISKVGLSGKLKAKKIQPTGEINLTQITNLAKRENEMRIKAAKDILNAQKQVSPPVDVNSKVPEQNELPKSSKNDEKPYVNPFVRKLFQSAVSTEEPYVNPYVRKRFSNVNSSAARVPLDPIVTTKNAQDSALKLKPVTNSGSDFLGNIMNDMNKQQKVMQTINSNINKENQKMEPNRYNINNFFLRLLKINYIWLIEQNTQGHINPPPILETGELNPLVEAYYSYDEYFKTMLSFLLLETWEEVSKAFRDLKTTPKNSVWLKSFEHKSIENFTSITCQGVFDNYGAKLPQEEDLYRVNLILNDKSKTPKKKDYFALVKHFYRVKNENEHMKEASDFLNTLNKKSKTDTLPKTSYSTSPAQLRKSLKTVETNDQDQKFGVYEIVFITHIRPYAKENINTILDAELLINLSSSLRRVKALIHFQNSPVQKALLEPNAQNPLFWPVAEKNLNTKLIPSDCNETQRRVVVEASSIINTKDPKFLLIQGPPGTGKTRTIINIVKMIFNRVDANLQAEIKSEEQQVSTVSTKPGQVEVQYNSKMRAKLLICSPSNGNSDEILRRVLEELSSRKLFHSNNTRSYCNIVRIGSKEGCNRSCEDFEAHNFEIMYKKRLEYLLDQKQSEKSTSVLQHVKDIHEREKNLRQMIKILLKSGKPADMVKSKELEEDLSDLLKKQQSFRRINSKTNPISKAEKKKLEIQAKESVIKNADILICTLNSCGRRELECLTPERNNGKSLITTLIVDEAAQCIEVDFLIPMKFGCTKVILVGDPEQLPATVISKKAEEMFFYQSFFERIYQRFRHQESSNPIRMLSIQYRMHPEICMFPSQNFYRSKLITDKKLGEKRLEEFSLEPYLIFDISDSKEICGKNGDSFQNPTEAACVIEFCGYLLKKFKYNIGIITPYKKQLECLKSLVLKHNFSKVEVGTVDSFQGREKDIVLLSSVRANDDGKIGFLQNRQRLNVSITRSKYALYIFCHINSLKTNRDWKKLLEDGKERKLVQSITSKTKPEELFNKLEKKLSDKSLPKERSNSCQK